MLSSEYVERPMVHLLGKRGAPRGQGQCRLLLLMTMQTARERRTHPLFLSDYIVIPTFKSRGFPRRRPSVEDESASGERVAFEDEIEQIKSEHRQIDEPKGQVLRSSGPAEVALVGPCPTTRRWEVASLRETSRPWRGR